MPKIGDNEVRTATYGASANWNESDEREAFVQIPKGYMVVKTKDNRASDYGRTSMNTDFIEAKGQFATNSEVNSSFKELEEGMVNLGKYGTYGGKINLEKQRWASARNSAASSHSAIRIKVSAKGSGNTLDRKGGSIKGTYEATLRYIGTTDDLKGSVIAILTEAGCDSGYFVKIRNPQISTVNFSFKFNDDAYEAKSLEKDKIKTLSTKALQPSFNIRFDSDTRSGYQAKEYRLKSNCTYKFTLNGTSIDLVKE